MKKIIPKFFYVLRQTYNYSRSIFYVGDNFICPCCGGGFKKLLTYGVKPRSNARCPRCGLFERHRLLWLYLKNKTDFFSTKLKVLHLAPEYFIQRKFKALPNLDYVSLDLNSPLAEIKADITELPFNNEVFDLVLCSHVLEHVLDDQKAIGELYRVIKTGGRMIGQVPADINREKTLEDAKAVTPEQRKLIFGQIDHVRIYGQDFKNRLEKSGFKVKVEDYITELGEEYAKRYCLKEDDKLHYIYFCHKN